MLSKLDEAKAELLSKAAAIVEGAPAVAGRGREDLETFLRRYYRHTSAEDILGRDPADVGGAAVSHLSLAERRAHGTANVRVHTPTVAANGWTSGRTVVEIVTDDMPFLVDSVTNELVRQGRGIHVVVHPQLIVRRDDEGHLVKVYDVSDPARAPEDATVESWMHVEIDRDGGTEESAAVEAELKRVLQDVREAVEDWQAMLNAALQLAGELVENPPAGVPAGDVDETVELLRWLADDHFTFLGYREYVLETGADGDVLRAEAGTGLGILRGDRHPAVAVATLPPEVRVRVREPQLLILTKANSRATVHRSSYLDYIGIKRFDADGRVVGERRFLGLLSASAYTESVGRIPVIKHKVRAVLDRADFPAMSHSGQDLLAVLETYPRDELFQISVDELASIALAVLHIQERRQLRLFLRRDVYGRFFSAMVYLPRDRYTTEVRLRMMDILTRELVSRDGTIDYTARNTESVLARLHFLVRPAPGAELPDVDVDRIEAMLTEAARSWTDDFADALVAEVGEERAAVLSRRYAGVFPEGYKADVRPVDAVADVERIEELAADGAAPAGSATAVRGTEAVRGREGTPGGDGGPVVDTAVDLYQPPGAAPGERRFKVYRVGASLSLTDILPVLQHLGMDVVDERPYQLRRVGAAPAWVYDFGLRLDPGVETSEADLTGLVADAFAAVWDGRAESDGFNALVVRAGLAWRQVVVLRAYAAYLRQAGTAFSQAYIERCLNANVHVARLLVRLFEARNSPAYAHAGTEVSDAVAEELAGALDLVESLDEDRILRSFQALVLATLRTNFFQPGADGRPKPYLSFKFDPRGVPDLPQPRPRYEIWVYSPAFEGVHLRFGAVARGGLRWSDRREDFRTEILGLVKAQMVKNTVIVPVGAKGGFVVKHPPGRVGGSTPAADRDAWAARGVACYRNFIRAMLDVTDNMVDGRVVPPHGVVRHDGDDPYLVVAADKGTATFSDYANEIAAEYGFWLDDAFASGGSAGYDHKAMGITARGAWESVKRHFRELGIDPAAQEFTVVGIGDMSGDVFGNGMLLSPHIRLVAAFDHRHIFLDPCQPGGDDAGEASAIDPAAHLAASYAERQRLFSLPRSSWADYDVRLISPGGGVYPRSSKAIPVTPQVRACLGIAEHVNRMTPQELIRAILTAPVDLLWNGGIGTYVKAGTESHADVGDRANDTIRVDGSQVRARVVGEGGNLGLTQLGRIEYALSGADGRGGRINTDAIDNSAGVDTSDHEVNIKILLAGPVASGRMSRQERDELLADMTNEIAAQVLNNNYGQNVVLATSMAQNTSMLGVHARYIRRLVRDGLVDRKLEALPTDRQLGERRTAGLGLSQPEIAVLLAHTKIALADALLSSSLPEDPYLRDELYAYFPTALRERFRAAILDHPLRREIITTQVVNNVVNNAGTTFMFRMQEETASSPEEITRAHTVAQAVFGMQRLWHAVEALDHRVDAAVQTRIRLHARRLTERATRWLLANRQHPIDIATQVEFFEDGVRTIAEHLPEYLRGIEAEELANQRAWFAGRGVPEDLATLVAGFSPVCSALDIVDIAADSGRDVRQVADHYFYLTDRFDFGRLRDWIGALPRSDRWTSMARSAVRADLYALQAALTFDVLASGRPDDTPEQRFAVWGKRNAVAVARVSELLADLRTEANVELAAVSVVVRVFRGMLRSTDVA